MANLNTMTTATSLANADKMYFETAGGERSITFENLKASQEGYFRKEGTALYDNSSGSNSITVTFTAGNEYEIYASTSYNSSTGACNNNITKIIRFKYLADNSNSVLIYDVYDEQLLNIDKAYFSYSSGTLTASNCKAYKIVEFEV